MHRISSLLKVRFVFPRPGTRQKSSAFPESQLIALLLVAVKLFHPFDQLQRKPRSWTEPGILDIDWNVWYDLQAEHQARFASDGRIGRGNIISVNEQDIMKMSGAQLDEYMDWFERTWISEEVSVFKKEGLPRELLDMFPTGRLDGSSFAEFNFDEESKIDQVSVEKNLAAIQKSLEMRGVVSEEQEENSNRPVRRIGSFYKRYRKAEDLTPQARKFHETAASLVGISLSSLLRAVCQMERKLQLWRRKQLKEDNEDSESEVSGDQMKSDDQDDSDEDEYDGEEEDDMMEDVVSDTEVSDDALEQYDEDVF